MYIYKKVEEDNLILTIYYEEWAESPRTSFDNIGKVICFHERYSIGDEHNFKHPIDFIVDLSWDLSLITDEEREEYSYRYLEPWHEDVQALLSKIEDTIVILPVYVYEHSGITISTSPFSCPWDSGQIGWVYAGQKRLDSLGMGLDIKKDREKIVSYLEEEIKEYDTYLRGDVFGFICTELTESGKEVETIQSDGYFYGDDFNKNGMKECIPLKFKHLLEKI